MVQKKVKKYYSILQLKWFQIHKTWNQEKLNFKVNNTIVLLQQYCYLWSVVRVIDVNKGNIGLV